MVEVTVATREKSKLRIALAGVSGGGKTLGALLLASGMTGGDFKKICLIDTEHKRGQLYANRSDLGIGAFYYIELTPPYSPAHYKEAVDAAVRTVGPEGVVIVDSLSHAWNSSGGVLEIKAGIAASPTRTAIPPGTRPAASRTISSTTCCRSTATPSAPCGSSRIMCSPRTTAASRCR